MNKGYYYKLINENDYEDEPNIIRTNFPCLILIENLTKVFKERNFMPDKEDEKFDEYKDNLLNLVKNGLNSVLGYLDLGDSNDFDNKAEMIVDDFINNVDMISTTEQYVDKTLEKLEQIILKQQEIKEEDLVI